MNSRRVTLLNAGSQQCRWIAGKIGDEIAVCGLPAHNRTSWCEKHHDQVFAQNVKRAKSKPFILAKSVVYSTKG